MVLNIFEASRNITRCCRLMNAISIVFRLSSICCLMILLSFPSFFVALTTQLENTFKGQWITSFEVFCFRKSSSTHERHLMIFNYPAASQLHPTTNIMLWNYAKRCFASPKLLLSVLQYQVGGSFHKLTWRFVVKTRDDQVTRFWCEESCSWRSNEI